MSILLDKINGSLIGGAIGDALGYPIEFMDYDRILSEYGEDGITSFKLVDGEAEISDDTQMTLYTACGLLKGYAEGVTMKSPLELSQNYVWKAYQEWHSIQVATNPALNDPFCDISRLKAMQAWRAPGMTCMYALRDGKPGSLQGGKVNDSKGCGTIMRVAPIALLNDPACSSADKAYMAMEVSALTHGHSLGFLPSALMVYMLNEIVYSQKEWNNLAEVVRYSLEQTKKLYGKKYANFKYLPLYIDRALELTEKNLCATDEEAIRMLGEGKVAEEALAIAVYCSVKYQNDFEKAIIASVNHGGDSDSTGAVTGNILGAWVGNTALPKRFSYNVEEVDTIEDIGERLLNVL